MAMDPKAAAAAAQAAAEAARAAAEAAAAAAAASSEQAGRAPTTAAPSTPGADGATASTAVDPDESSSTTGQADPGALGGKVGTGSPVPTADNLTVLTDTGVVLGSQLHADPGILDALSSRAEGAIAGATSADLLGLPGLSSATSSTGGLQGPTLKDASMSGGDIGKAGVRDWSIPEYEIEQSIRRAVAAVVDYWTPNQTHEDGAVDAGVTEPDETSGGTEGESDPDLDAGTIYEIDTDTSDDEEGASGGTATGTTAGGGTTGSGAAGGGAGKPMPDDSGGYTGSWQGVTPIGPGSGDDDLVSGATGNTGTSGGSGLQGPIGAGGWAINPGAEGFVAGHATDLQDAQAWYGGGGDPGDPDLAIAGGNPAVIDQGIQPVDGNTINPGSGDGGGSSDGEAQARTAYRAMPAMADPALDDAASGGSADSSPGDAGGPGYGFDDDAPSNDPAADPLDTDHGRDHGRGHGYGREDAGGHGRAGRDNDDAEAAID